MATLKDVVFDCEKAPPLARFWASVLDGYQVRPYDDEEVAKLAAQGLTPDTDPVVFVDGPGPNFCFQQVPEAKTAKNRVHVDLAVPDLRAEVDRLVGLGATIHQDSGDLVTLKDPEGNEFCITEST